MEKLTQKIKINNNLYTISINIIHITNLNKITHKTDLDTGICHEILINQL